MLEFPKVGLGSPEILDVWASLGISFFSKILNFLMLGFLMLNGCEELRSKCCDRLCPFLLGCLSVISFSIFELYKF